MTDDDAVVIDTIAKLFSVYLIFHADSDEKEAEWRSKIDTELDILHVPKHVSFYDKLIIYD